eukprot:1402533-Pyramimonas_sp.AAC.1
MITPHEVTPHEVTPPYSHSVSNTNITSFYGSSCANARVRLTHQSRPIRFTLYFVKIEIEIDRPRAARYNGCVTITLTWPLSWRLTWRGRFGSASRRISDLGPIWVRFESDLGRKSEPRAGLGADTVALTVKTLRPYQAVLSLKNSSLPPIFYGLRMSVSSPPLAPL